MVSEYNRTALFSRVQPGGVFTINDLVAHPGNIWFVDSGETTLGSDAAGSGRSPDSPFLTLDYAIASCTASNGDVIYCMPGHTEDLDADSAVDIDVAGISVIGLGRGAARPTFDNSAAAGDFKLAADSTYIENLLFTGGVDIGTGIIEVSAADCVIKNCEFRDVTGQATDALMVTDGSDRLLIDGYRHIGAAAPGANSAIAITSSDDIEIKNFYIYGNFAVGAIDFRTTASPRANIHHGTMWNANAADICIVDTITASTGFIGPWLNGMLTEDAATITEAFTGATFQYIQPINIVNLAGESSMFTNITASTDDA